MTSISVKSWYLVHKWTSLICTLFLLMLCVTGLPLIVHEEIDHALGYSAEAPELAEPAPRANLDAIVARAKARRPGDAPQFLFGDPGDPRVWFVRLGEKANSLDASAFYTYDARTGDFLNEYPINRGFTNFLLKLHVDMFAGLPGTLFLGFMGLLLVASLV